MSNAWWMGGWMLHGLSNWVDEWINWMTGWMLNWLRDSQSTRREGSTQGEIKIHNRRWFLEVIGPSVFGAGPSVFEGAPLYFERTLRIWSGTLCVWRGPFVFWADPPYLEGGPSVFEGAPSYLELNLAYLERIFRVWSDSTGVFKQWILLYYTIYTMCCTEILLCESYWVGNRKKTEPIFSPNFSVSLEPG